MPIAEKRKYALNWMARQKEPDFHLKCILFSKMRKNGSSFSTEIAPKPHCAFNVWHSLPCNLQNGMKIFLKSYFFIHQWFHEIFDYELPNQNSQCTVICFSTVALLCQWGAQYKSRYANVMLSYMICNIFFLPTFVKVETYWEFRWRTKVFVPKPALYIASVTIGKGGPNTYSTQIQWFMYQKRSERYLTVFCNNRTANVFVMTSSKLWKTKEWKYETVKMSLGV